MLKRGDRVAHYDIEAMLGQGGMGEVYLAVDSRLHRRVALKVIAQSEKAEEMKESSARLLREARAAASLTHPNVVSVFDVGEYEGRVYLAMEYVVGKTLRDLVKGDVTWQKRLRWAVDVARALATAHRDGLVHRDVKPENVMVRDDGLVKVLDFGIARRTSTAVDPNARTEAAGNMGTLTAKGVVIGTPMYMAPEQLKGGDPDPRTDQFAWGVMTYEVLCGDRPWPEKSDLLAAIATVLTEPPVSLRKRLPELPHSVEAVIHRTLSRDPRDRFETMDDVAEALDPLAVRSGSFESKPLVTRRSTPHDAVDTKPSDAPALSPDKPGGTTRHAVVTQKSPDFPGRASTAPQGPRKRWPFILGIGVTLASVGIYAKWLRPSVVKPIPSGSTSASTTAQVVLSTNPEALAAYREAMQHWRDGAWKRTRSSLDRALSLDPQLAAAHLLYTILHLHDDPTEAQDHYQKAFLHRHKLTEEDRRLLDALAPLARATADIGEAEQKLLDGTKKFPNDAMLFYLLGYVRFARSDFEQAQAAYDESIRLDKGFIPALRAKADVKRQIGRVDDALAIYDLCIKTAPAAAICLQERILLLRDRGECDRMEQDARAWQGVEPDAPQAPYYIAEALLMKGSPIESVITALKRQWDADKTTEAEDRANLAIYEGDFTTAEKRTRDWDAIPDKNEVMMRAGPAHQLAILAFERNDIATAGQVSEAFLRVLPALTPDPMGNDPTIWFYEYVYRANKMSKDDLAKKRASWLAVQEANRTQKENQRMAPFRWAMMYGGFAETMEEAKEALDALDNYLPLPPDSRRSSVFDASLGKVYALAGKNDDAIGVLERVTNACIGLDQPAVQTRSFYFLGLAREGKGDLEGAKKAYQKTVDRWGNAKPKSVTAEKAKLRLKQLD